MLILAKFNFRLNLFNIYYQLSKVKHEYCD